MPAQRQKRSIGVRFEICPRHNKENTRTESNESTVLS